MKTTQFHTNILPQIFRYIAPNGIRFSQLPCVTQCMSMRKQKSPIQHTKQRASFCATFNCTWVCTKFTCWIETSVRTACSLLQRFPVLLLPHSNTGYPRNTILLGMGGSINPFFPGEGHVGCAVDVWVGSKANRANERRTHHSVSFDRPNFWRFFRCIVTGSLSRN